MTALQSYLNSNLKQYINEYAKYMRSEWGLSDSFSQDAARLFIALYLYRLQPRIESGRRSAKKQAELLDRWKKGDPSVIVKPATNSDHLQGNAIDISTSNYALAAIVAKQLAIGAGYYFSNHPDGVHFFKSNGDL